LHKKVNKLTGYNTLISSNESCVKGSISILERSFLFWLLYAICSIFNEKLNPHSTKVESVEEHLQSRLSI
ncbi:MAG: hypothetical protein LBB34_02080, partial [Holosporales bacterium]|nr:hypothetical protein [Holosporales bacterium]